ncbi:hypothetical protein Avbf_15919 [Armadillidium vulgare]|nr:hypothetical protein Avbf_15919 [Armadillidium vulgare]
MVTTWFKHIKNYLQNIKTTGATPQKLPVFFGEIDAILVSVESENICSGMFHSNIEVFEPPTKRLHPPSRAESADKTMKEC